jgi:hypothetical protein
MRDYSDIGEMDSETLRELIEEEERAKKKVDEIGRKGCADAGAGDQEHEPLEERAWERFEEWFKDNIWNRAKGFKPFSILGG